MTAFPSPTGKGNALPLYPTFLDNLPIRSAKGSPFSLDLAFKQEVLVLLPRQAARALVEHSSHL